MNIRIKKRGSVTVEASILIPIFLIGMLSLISINYMITFEIQMQRALYEEAGKISLECFDGHNEAISTISGDIVELMSEAKANEKIVRGGLKGIDFALSNLNDPQYVQIVAEYSFMPFGADFLGIVQIPVRQKALMHVWCGYEHGFWGEDDGEYVYITNDSEVYHVNRECSHIKLSIIKVNSSTISELRNDNGSRYHSCQFCKSSLKDNVLYITSEGTRYHNNLNCSGLKRTVRAVRLTNIGDRRPCKRCG